MTIIVWLFIISWKSRVAFNTTENRLHNSSNPLTFDVNGNKNKFLTL